MGTNVRHKDIKKWALYTLLILSTINTILFLIQLYRDPEYYETHFVFFIVHLSFFLIMIYSMYYFDTHFIRSLRNYMTNLNFTREQKKLVIDSMRRHLIIWSPFIHWVIHIRQYISVSDKKKQIIGIRFVILTVSYIMIWTLLIILSYMSPESSYFLFSSVFLLTMIINLFLVYCISYLLYSYNYYKRAFITINSQISERAIYRYIINEKMVTPLRRLYWALLIPVLLFASGTFVFGIYSFGFFQTYSALERIFPIIFIFIFPPLAIIDFLHLDYRYKKMMQKIKSEFHENHIQTHICSEGKIDGGYIIIDYRVRKISESLLFQSNKPYQILLFIITICINVLIQYLLFYF